MADMDPEKKKVRHIKTIITSPDTSTKIVLRFY